MVGGAEEEFTAAKELLSCMGANVVYCGQVGTGQVLADNSSLFQYSHKNLFVCATRWFNVYNLILSQAAKICNNMLLAIGMIGTSETMNLGIRSFIFTSFIQKQLA